MALSESEQERYQRQLIVDGWDQEKLSRSRVLIVGAGGLGGISAIYLAAAGVGHIRICDSDQVELSNLNRQILYSSDDIGKSKADSAAKRLLALNPGINVESVQERLTDENAIRLLRGFDLIIDGLDNHEGRLVLNNAAHELEIPYIYAAINEWQGQLAFINPLRTACLACLFQHEMINQSPVPVFGALPGIIGSMQATLAIRYLISGIAPFSNILKIFHADTSAIETVQFGKNPACPVCGK